MWTPRGYWEKWLCFACHAIGDGDVVVPGKAPVQSPLIKFPTSDAAAAIRSIERGGLSEVRMVKYSG
jgi:hypothetical protein